jgi:hypothetical protein
LESYSWEPSKPGTEFGVKKVPRVNPYLPEATEVLMRRMDNPFLIGEFVGDVLQGPHSEGINQVVGAARAVHLDQIRPL